MKKLSLLVLYFNFVWAGFLFGNHLENSQREIEFIHLEQMSQTEIQQFFEKPSSTSILVCSEGLHLPLTFFLKGDLLEIDNSLNHPQTLMIKKTFFLCFQEKEMLISFDGCNWKTWQDLFTGSISISLEALCGSPHLQLGAHVYLKP